MSAKKKSRDYRKEALNESPARKLARKKRMKARYQIEKELTEKYGATKAAELLRGRDVDHRKPLSQGGSNSRSNLRLRDRKENQSDKGTIFKGKKTTRPKNPRKG